MIACAFVLASTPVAAQNPDPLPDGIVEPNELQRQVHPMEARDPVLQHYRLDTPPAELDEFAIPSTRIAPDAITEAFQFAAYEIALLVELGAVDRNTPWYPAFETINEQFAIDQADTGELLRLFQAIDVQLAARSDLFGRELTNDQFYVMWTVNQLPDGFYDQLATGEWGFVNGFEYAAGFLRLSASAAADGAPLATTSEVELQVALKAAVEALEIQQDLNELLRLEITELQSAVVALSNPVVDQFDSGVEEAPRDDVDFVLYTSLAATFALIIVGAVVALVHRRRAVDDGPTPEAMETTQALAGAKDEASIVAILTRFGDINVDGDVHLVRVVDGGLRLADSDIITTTSLLRRVVDTGQRTTNVLDDDPLLPPGAHAVMATPVIDGGSVRAVLLAHRGEDRPFAESELAPLETIAPAVGGSLQRAAELDAMSELALVDGLTALGNRRRMDDDLEATVAEAVAGSAPLGFAMIDVDYFKTYNDTHGHAAGDAALRTVADTIARCVRQSDLVYRYGGEEFSMLLPGASPQEAALVAERVRSAIEQEHFDGEEHQPGGTLTVSVGVATLASGSSHDLQERADRALYSAKASGRNRVAFA